MFINCFFFSIDSVRTVYNEFVLSLALKRHRLNAANCTAASFAKWSESTLLKRKYSDTMDTSNQIMPTKRRRMVAYEEILCDTDDEDTVSETGERTFVIN